MCHNLTPLNIVNRHHSTTKRVISQALYSEGEGFYLLKVRVIPKAAKSQIVGWEGDILKVKVNAVPEKGKANEKLIQFLSENLKISRASITLIKGGTSRLKTFRLTELPDIQKITILFAN